MRRAASSESDAEVRDGEAASDASLAKLEPALRQAQHIISFGRPGDGAEEWLLVAGLIADADLAFQEARRRNPRLEFPLLEAVIADLYEITAGFTDPEFLRQTRAARRANPRLFG